MLCLDCQTRYVLSMPYIEAMQPTGFNMPVDLW